MNFHWSGTLVSFLLILLQHTDPLQTRITAGYRLTTRASESIIVSSISSTVYLQLPANPTPAARSSANQGYRWLQIHLMKGLRIYYKELHGLHSAPQCVFIFYLDVHFPIVLDQLACYIVSFCIMGMVSLVSMYFIAIFMALFLLKSKVTVLNLLMLMTRYVHFFRI